jgi:hypothetical protein
MEDRTMILKKVIFMLHTAVDIELYDGGGLLGKWKKIKRHWYPVIVRYDDGKLALRFNYEVKC